MPRRRVKRFFDLPRNPLFSNPAALEAWQAEQDALGVPLIVQMAKILPSIADQQAAKAERIRQDNEAATAKRMVRITAQNDPEKRERERQRFQAKLRMWEAKRKAKARQDAADAEKNAKALAENPTLNWRKPRRKGWVPPEDYAIGGRRRNKKKAQNEK